MIKKFENYVLITDMDGTLIDSKGDISEENINAIKYFVEQGGKFTIATGRMVESARRYLKGLPIELPVILYNGTKVFDFIKEETVNEYFLEEEIKKLIKKVKKNENSLGIEIYAEENIYIFNSCRFTERFSKKGYDVFYEVPNELWEKNWTKILILGEEEEIDKLEEHFEDCYGKTNLIRSGENYLEIIPKGTSKGHAMECLCQSFNLDISKVIAVGDNMNDLEMLSKAAYGFCVENGNKKLMNQVKYKTKCNDNHAIAHVIQWLEQNIV